MTNSTKHTTCLMDKSDGQLTWFWRLKLEIDLETESEGLWHQKL